MKSGVVPSCARLKGLVASGRRGGVGRSLRSVGGVSVVVAGLVAMLPGCLLLEPECRKAVFEPVNVFDFDTDLEGFTVGGADVNGAPLAEAETWAVTPASTTQLACGTGALEFKFRALEAGSQVWIEKVIDVDTSGGFYLPLTFDFGTLDVAGAQGWTFEVSARTAEPFDSEEGVKKWHSQGTGKDGGGPGWAFVRRDVTFNLEPSASNKVWLRLGIRVGSNDAPRNREYYFDHLQVGAPEPR